MAIRYDFVDAPNVLTTAFELDESGALKGKAVCTSIGVFPYIRADGSYDLELRLPEEVFSESTLKSLQNVPVTLDHLPSPASVDSEGLQAKQVGITGNEVSHDSLYVSVDMAIQRKDAIEAVMSGEKRALSLGYSCDLEDAQGTWCGVPYTKIQRNIKIDHCAIVSRARQGDQARIRLDSTDAYMAPFSYVVNSTGTESNISIKEEKLMETIKIDEVEFSVEKPVIDKISNMDAAISDLSSKLQVLQAEKDTLMDQVKVAQSKLDEYAAKKLDEEVIKQRVNEIVSVIKAAAKADVDIKDSIDKTEIQKAVIAKVFPKANLEGKTSVYIDARFDGAIEYLESMIEKNNDAEVRKIANDALDSKESVIDSKNARKIMIERLTKKIKEE